MTGKLRYMWVPACLMATVLSFADRQVVAETVNDESPAALPADVVMQINDTAIPADWFLHEFRSTFFRHAQSANPRQAVFDPFMKRMLLAAKARELELDRKADVAEAIERRMAGMRAFMEYQLEMTRIDMINNALLEDQNISVLPEDVSAEDLELFFNQQIKGRPGAPAALSMVPAHVMETLRAQAAQAKLEKQLSDLVEIWRTDMEIRINQHVIDSVPFPEMKGTPPAGFGRP